VIFVHDASALSGAAHLLTKPDLPSWIFLSGWVMNALLKGAQATAQLDMAAIALTPLLMRYDVVTARCR